MTYFADTRVLKVDPQNPESEAMATATETLGRGRLVAFPTETVYGLGANAFDAEAVGLIYEAKERPLSDPLIVHISCLEELPQVATAIPEIAWSLARKYWPGPLTLVLIRKNTMPHGCRVQQKFHCFNGVAHT